VSAQARTIVGVPLEILRPQGRPFAWVHGNFTCTVTPYLHASIEIDGAQGRGFLRTSVEILLVQVPTIFRATLVLCVHRHAVFCVHS
jgi:hypothetical protein